MTGLTLAFDTSFEDLYSPAGLARLDRLFLERLQQADADLHARLVAARDDPAALSDLEESSLLLALAPHLEAFVAALFGIEAEVAALGAEYTGHEALFACKRTFVQRTAAKAFPAEEAAAFDGPALRDRLTALFGGRFDQHVFAETVLAWQQDREANAEGLDLATRYAAWALYSAEGRRQHAGDVVFWKPDRVDPDRLVPLREIAQDGVTLAEAPRERFASRQDFRLTDCGTDLLGAMDQAHYCIICHERGRDHCRHGFTDGDGYTRGPLGVPLTGCPLEQKISEMHQAMLDGHPVGALAVVTVDNPMVAGSGHRICNDCMRSCIYQKQTPVDIPEAETRMLKNVLGLPWGVEVYGLLTRWNPLNLERPCPKPDSGYSVLVVGAGPAGYTLAHYLMNEGHFVACVDGLKIEPLPPALMAPVRDVADLWENLDERTQAGFGGVAEYGITVRWDKNFLTVLRLLVERRSRFALYGGVRFGGALTAEDAFRMGFDHVALCLGAGKPTLLDIPHSLARGVRTASDFLMALQLTGAAKRHSVANLQLRLPVVVIGGGLTAIDTATEALAYYVRQVDKVRERYDTLAAEYGEEGARAPYTAEELEVLDEYLAHARALEAERRKPDPDIVGLLRSWGGATIAYRRKLTGSPAYRLNHEEVVRAFEQGIRFAELVAPKAVDVDAHGRAEALRLTRQHLDERGHPRPMDAEASLPARSILVAAGTQPNTALVREDPSFAVLDGKTFQAVDEAGDPVTPEPSAKPAEAHVLMHPRDDGRCMSFFGDLHPSFAGNVVKAMASARRGYRVVDRQLRKRPPQSDPAALRATLDDGLRARVHAVRRLTYNVVEVTVRAPLAAAAFRPGQFFRLQNFEANAHHVGDTSLAMEGIALTGALIDREQGLISLIALEMGGSSSLIALLRPGEPVVLMGPTGVPTVAEAHETVLLCGGGLGNAVLFSIAQAYREVGAKILYFAAYKGVEDRFHVEHIEANSDVVVWCCDQEPGFEPGRPQDKAFVGNIVQAMEAYARGELGETDIGLADCGHLIAIGSDRMMEAVQKARHAQLKPFLKPDHLGIASINSPMQCMMKEICGQCLQTHHDPETNRESVVFSCFAQDQPIDHVVFPGLRDRLAQNSVQEKLTREWIVRALDRLGDDVPRV